MAVRKDILGQLFHRGRNISDILTFNRAKAIKWQEKTLKKLLYTARKTAFGEQFQFDKMLISPNVTLDFANQVPISDYSSMKPYWQREFNGEANVTWPGIPHFFALSSGTTEGSSKYIPLTDDGFKSLLRSGRRQLFAVFKTDVPKDFFTKDYLMVGGCTDLANNGHNRSGDLSGITTANVPIWFDRFAIPGLEITKEKDWNIRLAKMVEAAPEWDVVMIAGAPAWIKILLERIIEHYKLENIHQIWPNFSVYSWGAVSLTPYKSQLDAMMGQPIKYFETYLASEGFIAFQTKPDSQGMRLMFRNKTYFEFVPFNETNFNSNGELLPNAKVVGLDEVDEKTDYAILITTCSGAWRYLIGDTIRFVDADACEIKISGRIKQFLSLCGEHLCVDNMNEGIRLLSQDLNIHIPEFTVKGFKEDSSFGHHWYLACDKNIHFEEAMRKLDQYLTQLNDDYGVERKHVLTKLKLEVYPESVFLGWMEKHGKTGGQSKFPRVLSDTLYEDWTKYLAGLKLSVK